MLMISIISSSTDFRRAQLDPCAVRYHNNPEVVEICHSDRFEAKGTQKRSYIINGFNDFFAITLSKKVFEEFREWTGSIPIKLSNVRFPSETIMRKRSIKINTMLPVIHLGVEDPTLHLLMEVFAF